LWRVQEEHEGWVSEAAIRAVADLLGMPYIRMLEIATFYTMFQLQPVGKKAHIQVCGTTPCRLRWRRRYHQGVPKPDPPRTLSSIQGRQFQLGRSRVPWRLRERADGADLEGYLRGSDQESFGKVLDGFASGKPRSRDRRMAVNSRLRWVDRPR
jgi:NADH-quinone oxidoreductase subunit E